MATMDVTATEQATGEQRLKMTYEEFLRFGTDTTHAEWVDGEVTVFMPPNDRHQDLLRFLANLIDTFVQILGLGKTRFAPYEMRVGLRGSGREPDFLFIATTHLDRLTAKRLEGPADLVIEVISDDSVHRDRVDKYDEYEAVGVQEYWIIDPRPNRNRASFYQLNGEGRYQEILADESGRYHSRVLPDFFLVVDWLWQTELPMTLQALGEIVGPDKLGAR
ncbi:MAG: Uma2 family endonuclease [Herpetosiphonaceae bacterium]|nr:Uma2 family endonuclease [Herpetosiphonaceae bacterium]